VLARQGLEMLAVRCAELERVLAHRPTLPT
jgi:hypothetical protein